MLNRYKIIYKKNGMLFHEYRKANNIEEISRYVRERKGYDALLVYVRKEEEKHDAE